MLRFKKATAMVQYSLMISIVALALTTMSMYLRRSVQAKVKDLTDGFICNRQLGSLNDPATENMSREVVSSFDRVEREGRGGAKSINSRSNTRIELVYSVEDLLRADYGKTVLDVVNPESGYSLFSETENAQDNDGSHLSGDIGSSDASANDRNAGGGTMMGFGD